MQDPLLSVTGRIPALEPTGLSKDTVNPSMGALGSVERLRIPAPPPGPARTSLCGRSASRDGPPDHRSCLTLAHTALESPVGSKAYLGGWSPG